MEKQENASFLLSLWLAFRSTIRGIDEPRHLAWGLTIGLVIGLLPKSSALPYLVLIYVLLSRANLTTALIGAFSGWPLGHVLTDHFDTAGWWLLNQDTLQPQLAAIHRLPLVPWFQIDNTIVAGGLIYSLLGFLPTYGLARIVLNWIHPWLIARIRAFPGGNLRKA